MFVVDSDKALQINQDDRPVTRTMATLSFLFSLSFSSLVIVSIVSYYSGDIVTPDALKDQLALVEVVAGGFLGLIVETLFGPLEPNARNKAADNVRELNGDGKTPNSIST
jgi:hypothetical protein